jgi:hypothetical protein
MRRRGLVPANGVEQEVLCRTQSGPIWDGRIEKPYGQVPVHDGRNDQGQIQTILQQTKRPCIDFIKGLPPKGIIIVTIHIAGHDWRWDVRKSHTSAK